MKCGHYRLSIKPTPKHNGLDHLEQLGKCVMLVVVIWGGFYLMGKI